MAKFMEMYACLHAHSTHSDGINSPLELAKIAHDEGYGAIVLTDHDTISGTADMIAAANAFGLESMLGIEFSTSDPEINKELHITAFHFDIEHPEMKEYLWRLSEKETDQTRTLFHRGVDIGYIKGISWDEVLEYNKGISWLCNEHVFRAMKSKGLATDLEYPEFFSTCYGVHRKEVPPKYQFLKAKEVIDLVHKAGGIACVAHPMPPFGHLDYIDYLVKLGIDGMEVWHGLLKGKERRRALELAMEHNLYISGGADHSGLLGGQYSRYERPEETRFYYPPLTLGTTKLFYEEIRDRKKSSEREAVIKEMLADEELWVSNGGYDDVPI